MPSAPFAEGRLTLTPRQSRSCAPGRPWPCQRNFERASDMNHLTKRNFLGLASALAATPALAQATRIAAAPSRRASGTIKLKDQTELFVKDWGRGRPVVLTHAWPLSSDCWDQIAIALVDAGYRVISYDRRGFGRSSQPDGG